MTTVIAETIVARLSPRYQRSMRQFLKFSVTGAFGAVVDFGTYNILTRGLGWTTIYFVAGYEVIAANLVSVFLAVASNFLFNKYWTFRNTDKAIVKQWSGYFVLNLVTFVLNQVLTSYFAFRVAFFGSLFGDMKDNAAKVLAIGIILFLNFLGSKFLIFRRTQTGMNEPSLQA